MSLRHAPLLYVFFEVTQLERQRWLFESVFGLPVIEVEPHMPHHRHGVVKYDAGGIILSLNLTDSNRFERNATDALVTDLTMPREIPEDDGFVSSRGGEIVDAHGHHFAGRARAGTETASEVTALRLIVDDLPLTTRFYTDVLDFELRDESAATSTFAAGGVDLILERRTAGRERQRRHDTYLIVFHTPDIVATQEQLAGRGAPFKRPRPGYSEIGGSSRFEDPAGHHLCLYQPSEESLTWGSGPKVMEIAHIEGGANARRLADRVSVPVRD